MNLDLEHLPLLRAYLPEQFPDGPPDLRIHTNDEMVQQWGEPDERDPDHALVYYYRGARFSENAIRQVVDWRFGGFDKIDRLLDFASGYGRVTRMLMRHMPASRITVTEINREAVMFQRDELGVDARMSASEPAAFQCEHRFDAIYAGSLFTHLPERTFRTWLRRLWELRSRRGVFIFSLHNARSILRDTGVVPDFLFIEEAHSRFVDPSEYGNTYVSDGQLERIIREELGPCSWVRIPRGLANYQDLCIVVPETGESFATLGFDIGPEGFLEGASVQDDGSIRLSGWSGNRSERWGVERVEVTLGGKIVATERTFTHRPDVEQAHGPAMAMSGWGITFPIDGPQSLLEIMQIRAYSESGFDYLLWIGTLQSAIVRRLWDVMGGREQSRLEAEVKVKEALSHEEALKSRITELETVVGNLELDIAYLRHDRTELQNLVAAMEASRFWRARNRWFHLKRTLGLTDEK